uniref:Uncharacterized protein n=1 Tax=Anopheles coluzzii TaxID=1518534 RepID=A0A8W7Q1D1_ANOCL
MHSPQSDRNIASEARMLPLHRCKIHVVIVQMGLRLYQSTGLHLRAGVRRQVRHVVAPAAQSVLLMLHLLLLLQQPGGNVLDRAVAGIAREAASILLVLVLLIQHRIAGKLVPSAVRCPEQVALRCHFRLQHVEQRLLHAKVLLLLLLLLLMQLHRVEQIRRGQLDRVRGGGTGSDGTTTTCTAVASSTG